MASANLFYVHHDSEDEIGYSFMFQQQEKPVPISQSIVKDKFQYGIVTCYSLFCEESECLYSVRFV